MIRNKTYAPPPDKAVTHRALLLAAIAEGSTVISNPAACGDTAATAACLKKLGVAISRGKNRLTVKGAGLRGFKKPAGALNAGESGTTARLLAGLLAGQEFDSVITGQGSLLKRPMERVTRPLAAMGAVIKSSGGRLPLRISGSRLKGTDHRLALPSAQVKSALLLAGLYAEGPTSITERFQTRDHTERLLKYLGARISSSGLNLYLRPGRFNARNIMVPGDISAAAPFIVAACLLLDFKLTICNIGLNSGRTGLIHTLKAMGAAITIKPAAWGKPLNEVLSAQCLRRCRLKHGVPQNGQSPGRGAAAAEPAGDLSVSSSELKGIRIRPDEIPAMIDELPLLALAAARARGTTIISGGRGNRGTRNSDRLKTTLALFKTSA